MLSVLESMPSLSMAWQWKVRIIVARTQQAQGVEDALCKKVRHHITPVELHFVPMNVLPDEFLRDGEAVEHVASAEMASDDEGYHDMADATTVNDANAVPSFSPPNASKGDAIGVTDAPVVGVSSVPALVSAPVRDAVPIGIAPPSVAVANVPPLRFPPSILADAVAPVP